MASFNGSLPTKRIPDIIAAIFAERGAEVWPAYSGFDERLVQLAAEPEVLTYHGLCADQGRLTYLELRYREMGGAVEIEEIRLAPKTGAKFRFRAVGWGLITIQFHPAVHGRAPTRITSNSEKRALAWAPTFPEMAPPEDWNWSAVERNTGAPLPSRP